MHSLMERRPAQEQPDDGRELYVKALLTLQSGEPEEAALLLIRALRRQPHHQGMRRNLVRALLIAERYEQVVVQANAALTASPDDAELHFARGTALNAIGQSWQAHAAFERALALQPHLAAAWLNMGNASADLDDLASAERSYRTAIRLDPGLAEAHASLGYLLTIQGHLQDAIETLERAIDLRADFAQAHWNLAIASLLSGDLQRGFVEYEWRKRHTQFRADFPELPRPVWDGAGKEGRTILVRAEQGFGDVIHFARYLPLIRQAGARPILMCAPTLQPLLNTMSGVQTVSRSDPLPAYDAWIDQISLPGLFGTTLDTIPAAAGYLSADPVRAQAWRGRLPEGRKIGIALAGNPNHDVDRRRSIPMEVALPLFDLLGFNFINLQHGLTAGRLPLADLTPWMSDFAETAALIDNLDLVITVDTSVAHLAGALGKPVWILLPYAPDWRWLLGRTDSPWYRSARLFRQPIAGDWASVLSQIEHALGLAA